MHETTDLVNCKKQSLSIPRRCSCIFSQIKKAAPFSIHLKTHQRELNRIPALLLWKLWQQLHCYRECFFRVLWIFQGFFSSYRNQFENYQIHLFAYQCDPYCLALLFKPFSFRMSSVFRASFFIWQCEVSFTFDPCRLDGYNNAICLSLRWLYSRLFVTFVHNVWCHFPVNFNFF